MSNLVWRTRQCHELLVSAAWHLRFHACSVPSDTVSIQTWVVGPIYIYIIILEVFRMVESKTGHTFTPCVGPFNSPRIVSPPKDTDKLPKFRSEVAAAGFESRTTRSQVQLYNPLGHCVPCSMTSVVFRSTWRPLDFDACENLSTATWIHWVHITRYKCCTHVYVIIGKHMPSNKCCIICVWRFNLNSDALKVFMLAGVRVLTVLTATAGGQSLKASWNIGVKSVEKGRYHTASLFHSVFFPQRRASMCLHCVWTEQGPPRVKLCS